MMKVKIVTTIVIMKIKKVRISNEDDGDENGMDDGKDEETSNETKNER